MEKFSKYQYIAGGRIEFSNTKCINCLSYKAITETLVNLPFKEKMLYFFFFFLKLMCIIDQRQLVFAFYFLK